MNKPEITLLVFTLNEEKNIKKLLDSVNWVKKIIIIDSHSSDRTLKIAEKYNVEIIQNKFTTEKFSFVEPTRNFGLSNVKTSWILLLDADETLSPEAGKKIRNLIKSKKIHGYWFPRRNFINKSTYLRYGYFYPDWQLRLFRNLKKYRYSGTIHRQIQIPKQKTRFVKDIEIYHNPSHSKYDSFLSFFRFRNYIVVEGRVLAKKSVSSLTLFKNIFIETARHFFRSFYRLEGFRDGFAGFRAAVNWGLYQGSINFYALLFRITNF